MKLKQLLNENVMADQLMAIDGEIWEKLRVDNADDLQLKWNEYLKLVKEKVRKEFGGGKLSKSMYKELEANNHHSLNQALKDLKYF